MPQTAMTCSYAGSEMPGLQSKRWHDSVTSTFSTQIIQKMTNDNNYNIYFLYSALHLRLRALNIVKSNNMLKHLIYNNNVSLKKIKTLSNIT